MKGDAQKKKNITSTIQLRVWLDRFATKSSAFSSTGNFMTNDLLTRLRALWLEPPMRTAPERSPLMHGLVGHGGVWGIEFVAAPRLGWA